MLKFKIIINDEYNIVVANKIEDIQLQPDQSVVPYFDAHDIRQHAEDLIEAGTVINGIQFKTNEKSLQRLRELLDGWVIDLYNENSPCIYTTNDGDLLTFTNDAQVKEIYHAAISYRSHILQRSAQLQNMDPIPNPNTEGLWTKTSPLPS